MGVRVKQWKGAWWVFVAHNGQRKAKKIGDQKAAKHVASEIRKRLAAGAFQLPKTGPRFAALAGEWLEKSPLVNAISETTRENYASFTRQHLVPYFGELAVTAITAETVEGFIAAKRSPGGSRRFANRPLGEASLRSGLIALRLILERAVKAGHLAANPARGMGRFPRRDEETVDPFTPAELRAVLDAAHAQAPVFATMLRVWMQTGLRAGEVAGLRWGDLDLERGVVVVQRTYSRGRIGPTKTRRARTVFFLHPVAEETAAWRPGATPESRAVLTALRRLPVQALDPEAPLFTRADGQPWDPMSTLRAWKRALKAASVRYRPPEQLRHTFASTLLSRNAPLLYVQGAGGWRSAGVLLRTYARWMPQDYGDALPAATPAQPAAGAVAAGR